MQGEADVEGNGWVETEGFGEGVLDALALHNEATLRIRIKLLVLHATNTSTKEDLRHTCKNFISFKFRYVGVPSVPNVSTTSLRNLS